MTFVMLHVVSHVHELNSTELEGAEQIRFEWCYETSFANNSQYFTRFVDTLSKVEFSGYTVFQNLVHVLLACPKLKILHLSTIGFRDFKLNDLNAPIHLGIEELRIKGNGALNPHELHLFKFFVEFIQFDSITCLKLPQGPSYLADGDNNDYDLCAQQEILFTWILQNASMLERFEVERSDVILVPEDLSDIRSLANLQLTSFAFRANSKGFEKILEAQRHLSNLRLLKSIGHHESKLQLVMDFIYKRSNPLASIYFEHKVTYTLEDMGLGNTSQMELHDCKIYKDCVHLRELCLSVSYSHDISDRRSRRPGGIANTKLLPSTLTKLSIKCDILPPGEMDDLREALLGMPSLEYFNLEGNRLHPMDIDSSLVRSLIENQPSVNCIDIKNCHVTDFDTLFDFAGSSADMRLMLQISPNAIVYRKAATDTPNLDDVD